MSFLGKLTKIFRPAEEKKVTMPMERKPKVVIKRALPKKIIETERARVIEEARAQAREIILEAKDAALKLKDETNEEARRILEQARKTQADIGRKIGALEEKEKYL